MKMKKKHKILREQFNIKEEELLENANKWTKEDHECGFSICETWALDYSFICWLAERVYRYKTVGGEVVNLEYHEFEYKGRTYNQLELIDILLTKCETFLKEYDEEGPWGDVDKILHTMYDICDIWKELLPAMWW